MNIFELIVFIVNIAIGLRLATALHGIGGYWLSIPGFALGAMIIPCFIISWQRYDKWAYPGGDHIPDCECGSSEFDFKQFGEEYRFVCKHCETQYKRRRNKTYTYINGNEVLYKQLVKHQGWVKPQQEDSKNI